jgi:hypothetical protein
VVWWAWVSLGNDVSRKSQKYYVALVFPEQHLNVTFVAVSPTMVA